MNATLRPGDAPDPAHAPPPIRRYQPRPFELRSFGKQSQATLNMHLDLYQAHVVQTNALLDAQAAPGVPAVEGGELAHTAAAHHSHQLSFELGGLLLHELLFSQYLECAPAATGSFELAACHNFGSIERWKTQLRRLATGRGPGWAITFYDPQQEYLHNLWVASHDLHLPPGLTPLFVLDLWEHAWLADYGAKGVEEYVEHALMAVSLPCLDGRIDSGSPRAR